jgi:hypothetical protein
MHGSRTKVMILMIILTVGGDTNLGSAGDGEQPLLSLEHGLLEATEARIRTTLLQALAAICWYKYRYRMRITQEKFFRDLN